MIDRFRESFSAYEKLVGVVDGVFNKMKKEFPVEIKCKKGCSDCCFALFDVSLVEALYLNYHFKLSFEGENRSRLIEKANRADRTIYKIKRDARKRFENGQREEDLLVSLSTERVRCPLLDENNQCIMYDHRPITCRLYGIPLEIGGLSHGCGATGFEKGKAYPTVYMEKINQQLFAIAVNMVKEMESKFSQLSELVMPVSAAILTEFEDAFLGIGVEDDASNVPEE